MEPSADYITRALREGDRAGVRGPATERWLEGQQVRRAMNDPSLGVQQGKVIEYTNDLNRLPPEQFVQKWGHYPK